MPGNGNNTTDADSTIVTPAPALFTGIESVATFDGSKSPKEFIEQVNGVAKLANWTEEQKITIVKLRLRGNAKRFVDSDPTLETASWEALAQALQRQFRHLKFPGQALQQFLHCQQLHGESAREYLVRLKLIANQTVDWSNDAAKKKFQEDKLNEDILQQFMFNLRMPVKQRVLSTSPTTLSAALDCAEKEELIERVTRGTTKIQALDAEPKRCSKCQKEGHYSSDCRNNRAQGSCFICGQLGHYAENCPRKREKRNDNLRCYNCNQEGHFIKDCPRRRQEIRCWNCDRVGHKSYQCTRKGNQQNSLNSNAAPQGSRDEAAY